MTGLTTTIPYRTFEVGDEVFFNYDFKYQRGSIIQQIDLDHLDYPLYLIEFTIEDELRHEVRTGFDSDLTLA